MKSFYYFLVIFFVFQSLISFSQQNPNKRKTPNIILILADDHGWSQTSVAMDPRIPNSKSNYLETPNIAQFASKSMRFTNGYSPAPLCTPTRRSILCGTSAARSGEEFVSTWLPAQHSTIPRLLKQANPAYKTAHFGKWGEKMISTPEECGYDFSSGMTTNGDGNLKISSDPNSGLLGKKVGEKDYYVTDDPKATTLLTDNAIQFIQKQTKEGNPFYLQVSYYATHLDVVARQETVDKYNKKGKPDRGYTPAWAAMLDELDSGVGRLLAAVDKLGIADNTYVIYTSDNGGRDTIPGGSDIPPNLPLDGAKHSLLEGGIRVPFIIRGPGIKPGSICNTPVVGYDFLPTFYQLAGGKLPLSKEIDGGSIVKLLNDPIKGVVTRPKDALYFSRPNRGFSAIRQGDYKLMLYWNKTGEIASRKLYNFNLSPTEEGKNTVKDNPQKADELQELLLSYLKSVNAKTVPVQSKGGKADKED